MQRMFAEPTEWHTPWMERVLPNVIAVAELDPARTIFTRFIPPRSPDDIGGAWRRYWHKWDSMTRTRLDPGLIDLVSDLSRFVPPASIEDKSVMSAWQGSLHARLQSSGVDTLIVSGADSTHDAMLAIYESRFGMQVETVTTADLVAARIDGML